MSKVWSRLLLPMLCLGLSFHVAGQEQPVVDTADWNKRIEDVIASQDLQAATELAQQLKDGPFQEAPETGARLLFTLGAELTGTSQPDPSRAEALAKQLASGVLEAEKDLSFKTRSQLVVLTIPPVDTSGKPVAGDSWLRYRDDQFSLWLKTWQYGRDRADPDWQAGAAPKVVSGGDLPTFKNLDEIKDPGTREEVRQAQKAEKLQEIRRKNFFAQRQLHEDLDRYTKEMQAHLTNLGSQPPFHSAQRDRSLKSSGIPDELRKAILQPSP